MAILKEVARFSCIIGDLKKHNDLIIQVDGDGNYVLVIQEIDGDFGNARSGGVRIDTSSGDPQQCEVFTAIGDLVKAIKKSHQDFPNHPSFVVPKK